MRSAIFVLQHHRVLLDGLLGLPRSLQRLIVQPLEVLDALLGGHQLRGKRLRGVVVLGGLRGVAVGGRLVGQRERLPDVDLQLLDVGQLSVEPHLQLALVADHLGGLLRQRLMLTLGILDGLLNLHLRIGVLVDLRAEQRHEVLPRLDERIGHEFIPPSSLCSARTDLPCCPIYRVSGDRHTQNRLRPPPSTRPEG